MTTEAKPLNLIQKLATVMAAVHTIPKSGRNTFHNYNYATEADINAGVRKAMAAAGVMLIPSVDKLEWREVATNKGSERIATLTVRYTVTDGVEAREFVVIGEGQDKGDKATYKAMTGAGKYALLKLFLIPTGDDPEQDDGEENAPRQARPSNRPETKPAMPANAADLWTMWADHCRAEKLSAAEAKMRWAEAAEAAFNTPRFPSIDKWNQDHVEMVARILLPQFAPNIPF